MIKSFTRARVPMSTFSDIHGLHHNYTNCTSGKIFTIDKFCWFPIGEERMRLEVLLPDLVIPATLTPSFQTNNVSKWYELKVTATVQCAGKTFDLRLTRDPNPMDFAVFPRRHQMRTEVDNVGEASISQLSRHESVQISGADREEPLPLYEEAPAYEEFVCDDNSAG